MLFTDDGMMYVKHRKESPKALLKESSSLNTKSMYKINFITMLQQQTNGNLKFKNNIT